MVYKAITPAQAPIPQRSSSEGHLPPKLRMSGTTPLLLPHAFMTCIWTTLPYFNPK